MQNKTVIEWAGFKLAEGVEESALLAASDTLQTGFLAQQKGFLRRDLVKTTDGQWVDVVYWASMAEAEVAMQTSMENPACLTYFQLMANADHNDPSAGVMHFQVMKSY